MTFGHALAITSHFVNLQISPTLGKRLILQLHIDLVGWLRTVHEHNRAARSLPLHQWDRLSGGPTPSYMVEIPAPTSLSTSFDCCQFCSTHKKTLYSVKNCCCLLVLKDSVVKDSLLSRVYHAQMDHCPSSPSSSSFMSINLSSGSTSKCQSPSSIASMKPSATALPYVKSCCAEGISTEITISFSHLVKAPEVPDWAANYLLCVYRVLRGCNLAGSMTCTGFQVFSASAIAVRPFQT